VTDGYSIVSLDELELPQFQGAARWAGVRSHFGIESFGVNAWTGEEPGDDVIGEHDEATGGQEELYVVESGLATFTVDGQEISAPEGTIVFIRDPTIKRHAVADEPGTRILAIGAKRGEVFTPSTWERLLPAFRFFASEEYDKAAETLEATLEEFPDDPGVLYNLACAESMLGRGDEAIEHLRRSAEQSERHRDAARTDTDLDAIRDRPEFAEIVS
jgi:quercetin dioxygenase-like cupin family protein